MEIELELCLSKIYPQPSRSLLQTFLAADAQQKHTTLFDTSKIKLFDRVQTGKLEQSPGESLVMFYHSL